MFGNGLSLDQAPPFKAPLRFFLTAPIFLLMAAIIFYLRDLNLLERWPAETIGLVHFFTLGFLVMTMMGVLTQMLPVLAGVKIPKVLWVSRIIHLLITLGALLFPLGMIFNNVKMIQDGVITAWLAIFIFYAIVLWSLQKGIKSFTLTSFKLSSISALVTLIFAGRLAWGWAEFGAFSDLKLELLELHIAWAFFGIVFILIMGVSYKVVPMFYVTPDHPKWLTHFGSKIIFSLLILWTIIFKFFPFAITPIKIGISAVIFTYAFLTIKRMHKRKRPIIDTTILYWFFSMGLFISGALFYALSQFIINELWAILAAATFAIAILSLITGMLYKIIPFLTWLHLTSQKVLEVPTMRELLPDRFARKQFYLHLVMVILMYLSLFFPKIKILFLLFVICTISLTFFLTLMPLITYRKLTILEK